MRSAKAEIRVLIALALLWGVASFLTRLEAQVEKPQFKLGLLVDEHDKNRRSESEILVAATEAFVASKRFEIVERKQLNAVLTEKDFQEFLGGQVNQKLSDVLGLDFIGVINASEDKVEALDGKMQNRWILDVRLIAVRTAKVFATLKSERIELIQPSTIREAGQALFRSIRETFPPLGYVVALRGKEVVVDLGSESGIREGDVLEVVREGERLIHPVHGTELPSEMIVVGELKVKSSSPALATCKTSKGKNFEVANLVRLKLKSTLWKQWILKIPFAESVFKRLRAKKKEY